MSASRIISSMLAPLLFSSSTRWRGASIFMVSVTLGSLYCVWFSRLISLMLVFFTFFTFIYCFVMINMIYCVGCF